MTLTANTITAPAVWCSYFINGDDSGLNLEEKAQADAWCAREGISRHDFVSCSDEPSFTRAMRLHAPELDCDSGDVLEYTYFTKG